MYRKYATSIIDGIAEKIFLDVDLHSAKEWKEQSVGHYPNVSMDDSVRIASLRLRNPLAKVKIGKNVVLDNVSITGDCEIGDNCVLSKVRLDCAKVGEGSTLINADLSQSSVGKGSKCIRTYLVSADVGDNARLYYSGLAGTTAGRDLVVIFSMFIPVDKTKRKYVDLNKDYRTSRLLSSAYTCDTDPDDVKQSMVIGDRCTVIGRATVGMLLSFSKEVAALKPMPTSRVIAFPLPERLQEALRFYRNMPHVCAAVAGATSPDFRLEMRDDSRMLLWYQDRNVQTLPSGVIGAGAAFVSCARRSCFRINLGGNSRLYNMESGYPDVGTFTLEPSATCIIRKEYKKVDRPINYKISGAMIV